MMNLMTSLPPSLDSERRERLEFMVRGSLGTEGRKRVNTMLLETILVGK